MTTKILCDVSDEEYYAGIGDEPMLSYSTAKTLVFQSPRHAYTAHPKLGGKSRKQTSAQAKGSTFDALLTGGRIVQLGPVKCSACKGKGGKPGSPCQRCNGRGEYLPTSLQSNEAKAQWAAIERTGATPILPHKYAEAQSMVDDIRDHMTELGCLPSDSAKTQVTILWEEKTSTGHIVQCCGRLDWWDDGIARIYDLKKIDSAHPDRCRQQIERYGYNIQAVAYKRGVEANFPELVGRVDFVNLMCEIEEPPFICTPIRPSGSQLVLGERWWKRAIDRWYECTQSGKWPAYAMGIMNQDASEWALKRDIEAEMAKDESEDAIDQW